MNGCVSLQTFGPDCPEVLWTSRSLELFKTPNTNQLPRQRDKPQEKIQVIPRLTKPTVRIGVGGLSVQSAPRPRFLDCNALEKLSFHEYSTSRFKLWQVSA